MVGKATRQQGVDDSGIEKTGVASASAGPPREGEVVPAGVEIQGIYKPRGQGVSGREGAGEASIGKVVSPGDEGEGSGGRQLVAFSMEAGHP